MAKKDNGPATAAKIKAKANRVLGKKATPMVGKPGQERPMEVESHAYNWRQRQGLKGAM